MKKLLIFTFLFSLSTILAAETFTLTNTFGGNCDALEGNDFFSIQQALSDKDEIFYKNSEPMQISDRLQLDIDHKVFEGRIRLDLWNTQVINEEEQIIPNLLVKGYGKVNFGKYFSVVAGNSFFSKFDIKAAELFALDDTPNYGKIIKSGLGLYGEIPFNKKQSIKLKIGTCIEDDTLIANSKELKLSFGGDFSYKSLFSAGFSARNVTAKDFGKYSVFAGGKIGEFKINAGFAYNNTDEDILPAETKYSASLSTKYKNDDLKFTASTDIVTGLSPAYLSSGKEKTQFYNNNAVPFMVCTNFDYDITKKLEAALNIKITDMLNTEDNLRVIIYPNCSYKFEKKSQEISAGTRFEFNKKSGTGLTKISIPLNYKIKIEK